MIELVAVVIALVIVFAALRLFGQPRRPSHGFEGKLAGSTLQAVLKRIETIGDWKGHPSVDITAEIPAADEVEIAGLVSVTLIGAFQVGASVEAFTEYADDIDTFRVPGVEERDQVLAALIARPGITATASVPEHHWLELHVEGRGLDIWLEPDGWLNVMTTIPTLYEGEEIAIFPVEDGEQGDRFASCLENATDAKAARALLERLGNALVEQFTDFVDASRGEVAIYEDVLDVSCMLLTIETELVHTIVREVAAWAEALEGVLGPGDGAW